MACVGACPWNIPKLNPANGKVVKCNYCLDRVDAGIKPACVTRCTAQPLRFVALQEL
ncbi:MAG: 4Fe-4S dicluster domain-containing protein [Desulfurivibrio sp.]